MITSNYSNIPDELKNLNQWVVWKLEIRDERLTKVPYQADLPQSKASSTNPKTWTSFKNAFFAFENEKIFSGIGFVFSKDDPYIGIDFDKCIDPSTNLIYPSIEQNIVSLGSYTEISQSGKGIHVIGKGLNPDPAGKGSKKSNFEMYSYGRYFTMTGNIYQDFSSVINNIHPVLLETLYKLYLLKIPSESKPKTLSELRYRNNLCLGDEEILSLCERAGNGSKFNKLWHGDIIGYPSQSEAEMALCCILTFYTKDPTQLQRLMQNSGLYRSKLDRVDYITNTIKKSMDIVHERYDPKKQMRTRWLSRRLLTRGDNVG